MIEEKLISIVTPVYNREDCIRRCLDSVVCQLKDDCELVVVNDGSSDSTLDILNVYAEKTSSIKVVSYEQNKGVNYARNRGVESASGKFVLFLDSDDMLVPDCILYLYSALEKYPSYKHYLFLLDDPRSNLISETHEYTYIDWLSRNISGDFVHFLHREILLSNPFDEEFRVYEYLGWLRITKDDKKQLLIPIIAINLELGRKDSVSIEYLLQNRNNMRQEYFNSHKFVEQFSQDLLDNKLYNLLESCLKRSILIGIAINEINENKKLLYLLEKIAPAKKRIMSLFNNRVFTPFVFNFIVMHSKMRNKKK